MAISQQTVSDIRAQSDIVKIISDYVVLKKRGINYIACCPFHQEKTPSFNVHPTKQIFKCFGCNAAGNVFTFIMNIEQVAFPEAVRIVATKSGIQISEEEFKQPSSQKSDIDREKLFQLNEWAAEFFENQLNTYEGQVVREYLISRNIKEETRILMRIGYAPDRWEALVNYLRQKGATQLEIEKSGLVTIKESGTGCYDRFRGRVMFPIADTQGRIIAFGGRTLGSAEPKYLNSPETILYTKGKNLFGLHLSKDSIRKTGFVILVEGYFDFILPFQEGIQNIVASLGTALTEDQVRLMKRFLDTPQVVINFDPDSAGQNATNRSLELFLENGFKTNVLHLPHSDVKYDPDTYICTYGAEAYRTQLKSSQNFIEYLLQWASNELDLSTPSGKAAIANAILPYLIRLKDPIERSLYAEKLSDRLKIDDQLIRAELKKAATGQRSQIIIQNVNQSISIAAVERSILMALLSDWQLRDWGLNQLSEEFTSILSSKLLFKIIRELHSISSSINYDTMRSMFVEYNKQHAKQINLTQLSAQTSEEFKDLDQATENLLAELFLDVEPITDEVAKKAALDQLSTNIQMLKRRQLNKEQTKLQTEVQKAETEGDQDLALKQAMKKLETARQLKK